MTTHVTSADGTRIAYDRLGDGPPVVLVHGILSAGRQMRPLAEELTGRHTVVTYDRRGRGESDDTAPYAVEREIEDIGALIAEVGGTASVYGHSSGAALALRAAAAGLSIDRLILHEPPYGDDSEESTSGASELARTVADAISADRPADALRAFFGAYGLPPEQVDELSRDPDMLALATTMPYDIAVMGELEGGTIPEALVRSVAMPTLVLAGGASPDFFRETAERIVGLLTNGTYLMLEGQDHQAAPDVVGPVVSDFLGAPAAEAG